MNQAEFQEFIDKMNSVQVLKVGLASYLVYQLVDSLARNDEEKGAQVMMAMQHYCLEKRSD